MTDDRDKAALSANVPEFTLAMMRDLKGCVLLLTPSGRISFMNRAGRTILQVDDTTQLSGRDWWDLWPKDSQEMIRLAIDRAVRREPVSFESVCPTLRGEARWWEVHVTPLVDSAGLVENLLVKMTDLTDRYGAPDGIAARD